MLRVEKYNLVVDGGRNITKVLYGVVREVLTQSNGVIYVNPKKLLIYMSLRSRGLQAQ